LKRFGLIKLRLNCFDKESFMAYKRKTWNEKMNFGLEHKVVKIDKDFADLKVGDNMLVPTPEIIAQYIKQIPFGVHASLQQMRKNLAAEFHADATCPVTSGIFLRIVSEQAFEALLNGLDIEQITPFWRMIDHSTPVSRKLSFGTEFIQKQRKLEGLTW